MLCPRIRRGYIPIGRYLSSIWQRGGLRRTVEVWS